MDTMDRRRAGAMYRALFGPKKLAVMKEQLQARKACKHAPCTSACPFFTNLAECPVVQIYERERR